MIKQGVLKSKMRRYLFYLIGQPQQEEEFQVVIKENPKAQRTSDEKSGECSARVQKSSCKAYQRYS